MTVELKRGYKEEERDKRGGARKVKSKESRGGTGVEVAGTGGSDNCPKRKYAVSRNTPDPLKG